MGMVRFFLQRVAGGLYVEREDIPLRGLRTQQALEFTDPQHFERWCDNDRIRFDHPLLHLNLKRDAADLWRSVAVGPGQGDTGSNTGTSNGATDIVSDRRP
jgi:hypothetical protein